MTEEPKTREEQLQMWQGRVKAARRYQEEVGNVMSPGTNKRRWDNNVNAIAGDFNSYSELGEHAIDVNITRATVKTTLPPLKLVRPKITVKPTVKEYKGINNIHAAEKMSVELNYWFRELSIRRTMGKALVDAQATNCGYAYLGMVDKKEDAYDASGERMEFVPTVRHKQPFVRRHNPKMVLVPPGYWDLEECPWVDIIFKRPLHHVAKKFDVDPEDIPTTERMALGDDTDEKDKYFAEYMQSDDVLFVNVHNVWCKETKKVYVFADDMEDYLEDPKDWPWETEGFPLAHYRPEDISDQYYGTPPLTYTMPQQKELNAARTALRKRFNKSKANIFVGSEAEGPWLENYEKSEDGEIIKTGITEDIRKNMLVDPGLPLDSNAISYAQVVQADYIQQSGQSAEQRGGGDPNVDSATASANIQRNANIRSSEAADGVRSFYLTIARKLAMMIAKGPNDSIVRRVEGPISGAFSEVKYTTKELRGEFQFEMDFSAKIPDTDAERLQTAMLRYNIFRMDPLVDPKELVLDVYKAQGEINPEAKLMFLRSPDEEHKMFMSGLQAEAHERDDHQQHVQAHDAFLDQITQAMEQQEQKTQAQPTFEGGAGDPQMDKMRTAVILVVTHIQDHVKKINELAGPGAKSQQVSKNQSRAGIKSIGNSETEAEMRGNPAGPVN